MKKSDFYYDLPLNLIAQTPLKKRDSSRMMLINKETNEINHLHFSDVVDELREGDVLVLNDTKVLPARLYGKRKTGGKVEVLLLHPYSENEWEVLVKPGRKAKKGEIIYFSEELSAEVVDVLENGNRSIKLKYEGVLDDILARLGEMPLPPYIHEKLEDADRYQTVYADVKGSAAAPTAGLHFTNELIEKIRQKGVIVAHVTLHVGVGTFRPVKEDDILKHDMHSEYYYIDQETCDIINKAKREGRRVISVGTTSTRTLESAAVDKGFIKASSGFTDIFIYPPYDFKIVDGLITNFHLPESTLIMLVSAFAGYDLTMDAYEKAIKEKYRFYSFGDCMFIK